MRASTPFRASAACVVIALAACARDAAPPSAISIVDSRDASASGPARDASSGDGAGADAPETNAPSTDASLPMADAATDSGRDAASVAARALRVACGRTTCRASAEICCTLIDEATNPPPLRAAACSAARASEPHLPRFSVCPPARGGAERVVGIECDDSAGCGAGRICCAQMWGSGQPEQLQCVEMDPSRRFRCDFGEHCVQGGECRTPNTVCRANRCVPAERRSGVAIDCGGRKCGGATPACCLKDGGALACSAKSACTEGVVECTRPSDCVTGEFCGVIAGMRTICTSFEDGNIPRICVQDADCPGWIGSCPRARCGAAQRNEPWRTCDCDAGDGGP